MLKVFTRDTLGSNKVYQEMLIEGRKKGLSVAGNRTLILQLEVQRLQKKVNVVTVIIYKKHNVMQSMACPATTGG